MMAQTTMAKISEIWVTQSSPSKKICANIIKHKKPMPMMAPQNEGRLFSSLVIVDVVVDIIVLLIRS